MRKGTIVTTGLLALALALAGGDALAKANKKGKKPAAAAKAKPKKEAPKADAKAVTELMGQFKWGMTPDEVVGVIGKQIDERYAEKLKTTNDVFEQNKLRKQVWMKRPRGLFQNDESHRKWGEDRGLFLSDSNLNVLQNAIIAPLGGGLYNSLITPAQQTAAKQAFPATARRVRGD